MVGCEGDFDGPARRGLGFALVAASAGGVFACILLVLFVGLWAAALALIVTIVGLYGAILFLLPRQPSGRERPVAEMPARLRWPSDRRSNG